MDLEPSTNESLLETRCEVCGTRLTEAEIEATIEASRPFLCAVHVAEELPVADEADEAQDEQA